jgi:SAM-dependent methyltransferase
MSVHMVKLRPDKVARAIVLNQAQRLPAVRRLKRLLGRERGGTLWKSRPLADIEHHVLEVYGTIRRYLGEVRGMTGIEIGPGDNLGVSYALLLDGCARMIAVERTPATVLDGQLASLFRRLEQHFPNADVGLAEVLAPVAGGYRLSEKLELRADLGDLRVAPVDFIFSNDVLEHVDDVGEVFRVARRLLKPGGHFINNVDFAGHNEFSNPARPLDFLTCGDRLYRWMFSNVVTSNRVRFSEVIAAAEAAGFDVVETRTLLRADPAYLAAVRPHLLERYRALSDDDLSVVQGIVVARAPVER